MYCRQKPHGDADQGAAINPMQDYTWVALEDSEKHYFICEGKIAFSDKLETLFVKFNKILSPLVAFVSYTVMVI